jgi:glycosyltransferase involved in cell wall biosynthesis
MARPRALVVIPCLNEEAALPRVVADVRAAAAALPAEITVLVVDDGSTDGTARLARALGVRVVRLCRNLGIGGAVQTGLRVAAREGFDCAVQLDGDGQHPAAEMGALFVGFAAEPAPDLVIGSRFAGSGAFRSTFMRRVGIRWLALLLGLLVRVRVTDPTSGFRLYGPRALAQFDEVYPYDYPEPESLALAKVAGLRVAEVPVTMRERQGGASSIGGLDSGWYMIKVTFAVLLTFLRSLAGRRRSP